MRKLTTYFGTRCSRIERKSDTCIIHKDRKPLLRLAEKRSAAGFAKRALLFVFLNEENGLRAVSLDPLKSFANLQPPLPGPVPIILRIDATIF